MPTIDNIIVVQLANGKQVTLNVGQLVRNLNADKLDGYDASAFAVKDHTHDVSGGGGLGDSNLIFEIPTGAVNSINLLYTVSYRYISGTLMVWLNGLKLRRGLDFLEDDGQLSFRMTEPPSNVGMTDLLEIAYIIYPTDERYLIPLTQTN